jgi:hypothetical protein
LCAHAPRKIAPIAKTSILFLILLMIIVSSGYTVDWSVAMRLTTHSEIDWVPSITSTTDGEIWVVWRSDRIDLQNEIFYKVFNGSSWTNDTRLTWDPYSDNHPSITQTSDGKIWVVWDSTRNLHDQNLYYKVFNGSSWTEDKQLTNDTLADVYPSITQTTDDKIWVVWVSNRFDLQGELFYKVFNGSSWTDDTRITTDVDAEDLCPSVMQDADGMIWVAFSKLTDGKREDIYYKQYNGTIWGPDVRLTFDDEHYESHPSIMQAKNGPIWVFWDSDRNDHDEDIYYKVFDGDMWSLDKKLTTHLSDDLWPSITQAADNTIWIAWCSIRLFNFDIYYKIGEVHDVAITEVTTSTTVAIRGENVSIEVTAQNQGSTTETFEVRYYVNSTLVGSKTISIPAGQTVTLSPFHWNTSGAPYDTYIINATAVAVLGEIDLTDNSKNVEYPVKVIEGIKSDTCAMHSRKKPK